MSGSIGVPGAPPRRPATRCRHGPGSRHRRSARGRCSAWRRRRPSSSTRPACSGLARLAPRPPASWAAPRRPRSSSPARRSASTSSWTISRARPGWRATVGTWWADAAFQGARTVRAVAIHAIACKSGKSSGRTVGASLPTLRIAASRQFSPTNGLWRVAWKVRPRRVLQEASGMMDRAMRCSLVAALAASLAACGGGTGTSNLSGNKVVDAGGVRRLPRPHRRPRRLRPLRLRPHRRPAIRRSWRSRRPPAR